MRPAKFLDDGDKHGRGMINGPRPSPLRIHQDSHIIHKTSSSSSANAIPPQQQRKPVIIYAHSPRVIHTKPRDFMALVQKLTGVSRYDDEEEEENDQTLADDNNDRRAYYNESSSAVTDERDGGDMRETTSSSSRMFNVPLNPFLGDIPLFTPNSSDYFCSSTRPLCQFSDMLSSSPNMGNSSLSPSFLEAMNSLPEY